MSEILNRIRAAQVAAGEDAVMLHLAEIEGREYVDPKDAEITRLRAELDAARATADEVYNRLMPEVERLRAAAAPFARWAKRQLDFEMPRGIAEDDGTPVLGCDFEHSETTVYVGDLKTLCAALSETQSRNPPAEHGAAKVVPSRDGEADTPHKHVKDHNGPHIPLTYGSAKSEVCACGAWRMVDHYDRPSRGWGWRTDSIEDAAKDDDER